MCYWFSENNNPVREEMSNFGQDQNSENMEAQFEGQGSPHRSTPVVRESGNRRTSRTHENQKNTITRIPLATTRTLRFMSKKYSGKCINETGHVKMMAEFLDQQLYVRRADLVDGIGR